MSEDFKIVTRKSFNVAGPCFPSEHYMLSATERLPSVTDLIVKKQYFVIHAARQSGKTTALKYLTQIINASGNMCALYCSLEAVQQIADADKTLKSIASLILTNATLGGLISLTDAEIKQFCEMKNSALVVRGALQTLAETVKKPLAVFFDEVDCLPDNAMISFLRQLRDGYVNRNEMPFPASVALVGMRNIQDFKVRIRPESETLGTASPFNVLTESLTLRTFNEKDVRELYAQHTAETGQVFNDDVFETVMHWTGGQPWLVNAVARECVEKIHGLRYDESVTREDVLTAKEAIIRRRDTHILSLMSKLDDPRVMKIVEPVITGQKFDIPFDAPDCQYVLDLGIMKIERGALVPSNQMYAEMIVRYLSYGLQTNFLLDYPQVPWITSDGLDMNWLVRDFQKFWRRNARAWKKWYEYPESAPHIMFMAFLQRVVNGGGILTREMALGSCRMDIGLVFKGRSYGVEIKTRKNYRRKDALAQVCSYLDIMDAPEGWLLVFDTGKKTSTAGKKTAVKRADRFTWEDVKVGGKIVHIVGF